jgi:hypothetical protein
MLRKTIYATLIVILMMGAASAQQGTQIQGMPGYSNDRSDAEKKNDRDIDRAYQSTTKRIPDAEKKKPDPWADLRPAPHQQRPRTNNSGWQLPAASRRPGLSRKAKPISS